MWKIYPCKYYVTKNIDYISSMKNCQSPKALVKISIFFFLNCMFTNTHIHTHKQCASNLFLLTIFFLWNKFIWFISSIVQYIIFFFIHISLNSFHLYFFYIFFFFNFNFISEWIEVMKSRFDRSGTTLEGTRPAISFNAMFLIFFFLFVSYFSFSCSISYFFFFFLLKSFFFFSLIPTQFYFIFFFTFFFFSSFYFYIVSSHPGFFTSFFPR